MVHPLDTHIIQWAWYRLCHILRMRINIVGVAMRRRVIFFYTYLLSTLISAKMKTKFTTCRYNIEIPTYIPLYQKTITFWSVVAIF